VDQEIAPATYGAMWHMNFTHGGLVYVADP